MASKEKLGTFKLLWKMVNEIERYDEPRRTGTIIGRTASIIDDRIEDSGYSRSTDSLKLYTIEQLQEEIDSRKL